VSTPRRISRIFSGRSRKPSSRRALSRGDLNKAEVRARARALGLVTADKPESQEICFIPDNDYRGFPGVAFRRPSDPAPSWMAAVGCWESTKAWPHIRWDSGRGLGLSTGRTLYVTRLDPARNTVVVGDAREVEVDTLVAEQVNWISVARLDGPLDVLAQIRHRHTPARATIRRGTGESRYALKPHNGLQPRGSRLSSIRATWWSVVGSSAQAGPNPLDSFPLGVIHV